MYAPDSRVIAYVPMDATERHDATQKIPAGWQALEASLAAMKELSATGLSSQIVSSLGSLYALRNDLTQAVRRADGEPGIADTLFVVDFGAGKTTVVLAEQQLGHFWSAQDPNFASLSPRERANTIRLRFHAWLQKVLRLLWRVIATAKRQLAQNYVLVSYAIIQRQWHIHHGAHPPDESDTVSLMSIQRPGACPALA